LAQQIFDTMIQVPGTRADQRLVHAKGIVCKWTFAASKDAAALSVASHFQGPSVPVTVRFSAGASDPMIPDGSPGAGPRGMAIRFTLPGGGGATTDIVAISQNGFVVGNGAEFLALQKAVVATDPTKPHPWPIEAFLSSRPLALKFVQESAIAPESFATEAFFSNDSFVFVNKAGTRQTMRYQIIPVAGTHDLSASEAKAKSPNFLAEDLKSLLPKAPVQYRLVAQLPNPGDITYDPSLVWPDDRKTVDLGTISIASVDPDGAAEKALAYTPTNLTDGIELSDDLFPALRGKVYAMSVARRHGR
ncbi:MAG: catalase family peroxidase, partial [Gammaproteobacteria bacterium]